jgi:hypothetical protein
MADRDVRLGFSPSGAPMKRWPRRRIIAFARGQREAMPGKQADSIQGVSVRA